MCITQNIENFNAQILATVLPCARIFIYDTQCRGHNFWREDSPKNWTLWNFLSLSSLWNILLETFFWCLLICSFRFKIITYIRADTEKGPLRSNCSFSVSACMYVMILNGKLHMSKLQKQVSNRIFHKEEKERERSYIYVQCVVGLWRWSKTRNECKPISKESLGGLKISV